MKAITKGFTVSLLLFLSFNCVTLDNTVDNDSDIKIYDEVDEFESTRNIFVVIYSDFSRLLYKNKRHPSDKETILTLSLYNLLPFKLEIKLGKYSKNDQGFYYIHVNIYSDNAYFDIKEVKLMIDSYLFENTKGTPIKDIRTTNDGKKLYVEQYVLRIADNVFNNFAKDDIKFKIYSGNSSRDKVIVLSEYDKSCIRKLYNYLKE